MSSLPEEKVPYIDSIGERHRNKQIIVQLPPYDSEARYCNGLTDEEKRELRIFVALRKRDAIDRGVVKQIPDVSEGYSCREVRNYFGSIRAFVVSDFQKLHVSELAKVDNGILILFTCEWHVYLPMHTCMVPSAQLPTWVECLSITGYSPRILSSSPKNSIYSAG